MQPIMSGQGQTAELPFQAAMKSKHKCSKMKGECFLFRGQGGAEG